MESFYTQKALVPLEKLYPSTWSANTITIIGQIPPILVMLYAWTFSLRMDAKLPDWLFLLMAFGIQWFSINDCLDGMRARSRKCGSPLGRIIDEGFDQVAYSTFGCFIGYLIRLEPSMWVVCIAIVNFPFYAMEIKHSFAKNFIMIMGEIGPVETELLYTIIFFVTGAFLGGDYYEQTLA